MSAIKPLPQPWHPPTYDEADVLAVQAVAQGVGSKDQQQRAVRWIVERACGTYQETYFADSERNAAYAQGKRGVGLNIVTLINYPPQALDALRRKSRPK